MNLAKGPITSFSVVCLHKIVPFGLHRQSALAVFSMNTAKEKTPQLPVISYYFLHNGSSVNLNIYLEKSKMHFIKSQA